MGSLIGRELSLNVGGLRIASRSLLTGQIAPVLRVVFRVVLSIKPEANSAEITIHNLNKNDRSRLQTTNLQTTINVGYIGSISTIFSGELEFGRSIQSGTDWTTTIQAGDGSRALKTARINESLKGPVSAREVVRRVAKSLGLGLGNLEEKIKTNGLRKTLQEYTSGKALTGRAEQVLTKELKAMGLGWSVQNGKLQVLGPKDTTSDTVARLAVADGVSTGIIGSPEPGEKGVVKVKALIQPDLLAGRMIQIQSAQIDGFYRIDKSTFTGDTWGPSWYSEIEATPI